MKRKIIVAVLVLFMASSVAALNVTESQLDVMKTAYNQNTGQVPDMAKDLIGGQRVVLHLEGQGNYSAVMDGVKMEKLDKGQVKNPSLEIWTDMGTVKDIASSKDKRSALKEELESGGIEYEAYGFMNRMKFWFAEMFL